MTVSAAEKSLQATAAVCASWANTDDVAARMAPAWQARDARFLKQADPRGVLPPAERERRAAALRKAFYADMARKSAKSRRLRREAQSG